MPGPPRTLLEIGWDVHLQDERLNIIIHVSFFVQMKSLLCSKWTIKWLAKQTGDQLITRHGTRALPLSWTG